MDDEMKEVISINEIVSNLQRFIRMQNLLTWCLKWKQ